MKTKLLLITFILLLFNINYIYSLEFDNIKSDITLSKGESLIIGTKEIAYNDLWAKYEPIEIKNAFGLGETLFKGAITKHTESCSSNCESIMTIELANKGLLIEDITFKRVVNKDLIDYNIEYNIYVQDGEKDAEELACSPTLNVNGTDGNECSYVTKRVPNWVEFDFNKEYDAGTYTLLITGKKSSKMEIDWQIKTQGKWINEWAVWGFGISQIPTVPMTSNSAPIPYQAYASSNNTPTTLAYKAFSKNETYPQWVSAASIPAWIVIDLGSAQNISNFTIRNQVTGSSDIRTFAFQGTNNNASTWTDLINATNPNAAGNFTYNISLSTAYRYYRVYINATYGATITRLDQLYLWSNLTQYINLTSPVNYAYVNNTTQVFNCSATILGGLAVRNISLWTNATGVWHRNETKYRFTGSANINTTSGSWTNPTNLYDGNWSTYGNVPTGVNPGQLYQNFSDFEGGNYTFKYQLNAGNAQIVVSCYNYSSLSFDELFDSGATTTSATNRTLEIPSECRGNNHLRINVFLVGYGGIGLFYEGMIEPYSNSVSFTKNLPEHSTKWNCEACDSDSGCGYAANDYLITIDSSSPTITITSGNGNILYGVLNKNHTVNFTVYDLNLSSCWYDNGTLNKTINCSLNYLNETIDGISDNLTLYANDTLGNTASQFVEWNFSLLENNRSYINDTYSGISNPFLINFYYNTNFTGITVILNYNNTNYTMSTLSSVQPLEYYLDIAAPVVSSQINKSFNYIIGLSNSTGVYYIYTYYSNQTIRPFTIDNCSTNSNVLLNMTMFDEETFASINGTIEALVNIYVQNTRILVATYNRSFNHLNSTPSQICTNITGNYSMDYTLKHYGNNSLYFTKYRQVQNKTLNTTSFTNNIKLYNLLIASGYAFRILVTGSVQDELLVEVEKQNIPLADFNLVESQTTSAEEEAIVHLVPQNPIYNFIVSYMGTVLQEFNNYQVSCQNPSIGQCYIILTLSNIPTTPSYNDYLNVSISNSINQTSGIIYTSFSSTDSQPHIISQVVLKNDGYMNQTICNNSLSAVDGTISCTIPSTYQNSSYILKTYVDGTLKTISYLTQGTDPDWRGVDVFIELFMFSTLVLLMLAHPILIIIGAMLGMLFSIALIYVSSGSFSAIIATTIWFTIAGGIIIWQIYNKMRKF